MPGCYRVTGGRAEGLRIQDIGSQSVVPLLDLGPLVERELARGGRVALGQIDAPKAPWKSPLDAFEDASKHETKITGMINDLMNLVAIEKDGAGHDFLEWFCREQVEEEAQVQLIVSQLKLAADNGLGRYLLDQQLGGRAVK